MGFFELYGVALAGILAVVTLLWLVSVAVRDASIIDIFWGVLFVVVAWSLLFTNRHDVEAKMLLATLLVTIWGLRLAFHLAMRNLGHGEDSRYALWRLHGGPNWWLATYYRIYLLQGGIALIVAAPLIAVFNRPDDFFIVNALGLVLWAAGFAFEFVADLQLTRFRADPANQHKVMDQGLWRLSRHPNYFGDAVQWWGLGLFAFTGATAWALVGPLAMTLLFLYVSNDVIEKGLKKRRPEYVRYVASTNAFFPWPSRAIADDTGESRTMAAGRANRETRAGDGDGDGDTT